MNFSIHPNTLAAVGSLTQDTYVKALKEKMDMLDCIRSAYFFPDVFIGNFQYIFQNFQILSFPTFSRAERKFGPDSAMIVFLSWTTCLSVHLYVSATSVSSDF